MRERWRESNTANHVLYFIGNTNIPWASRVMPSPPENTMPLGGLAYPYYQLSGFGLSTNFFIGGIVFYGITINALLYENNESIKMGKFNL